MNTLQKRPYTFKWKDIGDIDAGRPNLGKNTSVAIYRLMQYTLRSTFLKEFGAEHIKEIFNKAGKLAGKEFCKNILNTKLELNDFLADLHQKLIDFSIGVLKIEKADIENLNFTLTISEDLDCSGLPIYGETVCDFDEGFIAGIFLIYTGKEFDVKEIDCWSTGDRTCRFTVKLVK
jgi:predicted hydrocarbon binding protein